MSFSRIKREAYFHTKAMLMGLSLAGTVAAIALLMREFPALLNVLWLGPIYILGRMTLEIIDAYNEDKRKRSGQ